MNVNGGSVRGSSDGFSFGVLSFFFFLSVLSFFWFMCAHAPSCSSQSWRRRRREGPREVRYDITIGSSSRILTVFQQVLFLAPVWRQRFSRPETKCTGCSPCCSNLFYFPTHLSLTNIALFFTTIHPSVETAHTHTLTQPWVPCYTGLPISPFHDMWPMASFNTQTHTSAKKKTQQDAT